MTAKKTTSKKKAAAKKQASKKKAATQRQPRRRGRPTKYTPDLGDAICLRLAEGEPLRVVCEDADMPSLRTVLRWLSDGQHEEFCQQHARAREARAELEFDAMIEIADNGQRDVKEDSEGNEYVDHEVIQRDRLRVDTRKWILARTSPKRYGDKQQVEHQGGMSVAISMDTEPLDEE